MKRFYIIASIVAILIAILIIVFLRNQKNVITGKVVDPNGNTPVAGVLITTIPATTSVFTDQHGEYFLEININNIYIVNASKDGKIIGSVHVVSDQGRTTTANIQIGFFADAQTTSNSISEKSQLSQEGLIAYYPFNGNTNDESGNSHFGKVVGASLTDDRFRMPQKAYLFDGSNDYFEIENFPLLNNEFTYSLWIRILGNNWNNDLQCFGILGPGGIHTWDFTYNNTALLFDIWDYTNSTWKIPYSGLGSGWSHVLIRYQSNIQSIWVNGTLLGTRNVSLPITPRTGRTLLLGASDFNRGQQLNGILDDIRIYNRSLSDSEIQSLYHEDGW
jgi:hypothetical protein